MKKYLSSAIVCVLTLASCNKAPSVTAMFTTDKDSYQIMETIFITNTSTARNTSIGLCKWEVEGTETYEMELNTISFDKVGRYPVTLTVYAEEGVARDTYTKEIIVENNNDDPVANFEMTPGPYVTDKTYSFTDKSTDEIGGIESWYWNIGGVTSTSQNPEVSFIAWGEVLVSLTVTDLYGGTSTMSRTVHVSQAGGHELGVEWSRDYEDASGAVVWWTSPAVTSASDRIYVTSTGNSLVCFDASGNRKGVFDLASKGLYQSTMNYPATTPSLDAEGNVYVAVQNASSDTGNGGVFSIMPECSGLRWYTPTGAKSSYRYIAPVVTGDYVAVCLRENDSSLMPQNAGVFSREDGKLVQALICDQGSYGGISANGQGKIVYGSNRAGAGYKVAVPLSSGSWSTSANGNLTPNLLNGSADATYGAQIAISNVDGSAYVCGATSGDNALSCGKFDLDGYTGIRPSAYWMTTVKAKAAMNGHGAVLDHSGNAYFTAGDKVFRLNGHTGALEWEFPLSGGCGVSAIDAAGYLYVCDHAAGKLYKLSSANGQAVASTDIPSPRSCPTIAPDGSIYITANGSSGPALYKVRGTGVNATKAPGYNWSQLGCTSRKNGSF